MVAQVLSPIHLAPQRSQRRRQDPAPARRHQRGSCSPFNDVAGHCGASADVACAPLQCRVCQDLKVQVQVCFVGGTNEEI